MSNSESKESVQKINEFFLIKVIYLEKNELNKFLILMEITQRRNTIYFF